MFFLVPKLENKYLFVLAWMFTMYHCLLRYILPNCCNKTNTSLPLQLKIIVYALPSKIIFMPLTWMTGNIIMVFVCPSVCLCLCAIFSLSCSSCSTQGPVLTLTCEHGCSQLGHDLSLTFVFNQAWYWQKSAWTVLPFSPVFLRHVKLF